MSTGFPGDIPDPAPRRCWHARGWEEPASRQWFTRSGVIFQLMCTAGIQEVIGFCVFSKKDMWVHEPGNGSRMSSFPSQPVSHWENLCPILQV